MYQITTGLPPGVSDLWLRNCSIGFQRGQQVQRIRTMELTSQDVAAAVSADNYCGGRRPAVEAAENDNVPYFVTEYYMYLAEHGRPPLSGDAWVGYQERFSRELSLQSAQRSNPDEWRRGLEHRFLRAYPSILRDFHFFLQARESSLFDEVAYSLTADVVDGVDIGLRVADHWTGACLRLDSRRSDEYNLIKKGQRHPNRARLCDVVEVTLKREACTKAGDYWLYPPDLVQALGRALRP